MPLAFVAVTAAAAEFQMQIVQCSPQLHCRTCRPSASSNFSGMLLSNIFSLRGVVWTYKSICHPAKAALISAARLRCCRCFAAVNAVQVA